MDRLEYVKCVMLDYATPDPSYGKTWCGRPRDIHEFRFVDASHALLNAREGGRLLICKGCAKAMGEALKKGSES